MDSTLDLFEQLPKEIKLAIYDYLLPNELSQSCRVCSKWNLLLSSDLLWQKFFSEKKSNNYGHPPSISSMQDTKPLKWIYINRKVNWLHGEVEKFSVPGLSDVGGSFYICHMLSGTNTLLIGCRSDVMREVDLTERKMIKSYKVPTGPASSYRMDDTSLVINRSDLRRWKRHEHSTVQGQPEEFDFLLPYPDSSHESYKFVKERLLIGSASNVKLYDMNTSQQMWSVDSETSLERVLWNGLDMDYNRGLRATGQTLQLFDLNDGGKQIMRINCPSASSEMICKLEGNLVCYSVTNEVSMVDLRNPEQKLWSTEVKDGSYLLKKIYFDEFKCIVGAYGQLVFFDSQNGKLLYTKECPGMNDFACNDEYLVAVAGQQHFVFDFTKRYVAPPNVVETPTRTDQNDDRRGLSFSNDAIYL